MDLYNAVNNSAYNNINDLEVNTLEDAVYLSMKNDISFTPRLSSEDMEIRDFAIRHGWGQKKARK